MQRLINRITKEFPHINYFIEVKAFDGNGDSFLVYSGALLELLPVCFANVLRHPGCFYFLNVSGVAHSTDNQTDGAIIERELCWLTDPLAPEVEVNGNYLIANWQPASFCGISPPDQTDSVVYTLQICEGVDFKDGYMSKYMTDATAINYHIVCSGPQLFHAKVTQLRPAKWYHVRLTMEYLGYKVMSEARSVHTSPTPPSAPGPPRINIVPVADSFDVCSTVPARYDVLVSWNSAGSHGSKILKYQLQLQCMGFNGEVLEPDSAYKKRTSQFMGRDKMRIFDMPDTTKESTNQWVRSPGKSPQQIYNSMFFKVKPSLTEDEENKRQRQHQKEELQQQQQIALMRPNTTSSPERAQTAKMKAKWAIPYENLNRHFKIPSPGPHVAGWNLRVRAYNSFGWSPFSQILKVNNLSHPTLFPLHAVSPADDNFQPTRLKRLHSVSVDSFSIVTSFSKANKNLSPEGSPENLSRKSFSKRGSISGQNSEYVSKNSPSRSPSLGGQRSPLRKSAILREQEKIKQSGNVTSEDKDLIDTRSWLDKLAERDGLNMVDESGTDEGNEDNEPMHVLKMLSSKNIGVSSKNLDFLPPIENENVIEKGMRPRSASMRNLLSNKDLLPQV